MVAASSQVPIHPLLEFPADEGLPELPELFDGESVWRNYCLEFGTRDFRPHRILIQGISRTPGRGAAVSYEFEWPDDAYLPNERVTFHLARGNPLHITRFPDDLHLPGLGEACDPESAQRLVGRHVTVMPPRRMRVQVVRYRPGSHAVLRHRMGKSRLYVRVVRPSSVPAILRSGQLIEESAFVVPKLAGLWQEGGVFWFSEIPGRNLRRLLNGFDPPPPRLILKALESLWAVPPREREGNAFNLTGAYRRAKDIISHSLGGHDGGFRDFRRAVEVLDPFCKDWKATGTAHNDFYDDQMIVLPDGKIALVDIEGAGLGDPMLDVGNFLAHLNWSSRVSQRGGGFAEYHEAFLQNSLERFRWVREDLALREAVCLFRICTNAVRNPREDWRERLAAGLSLVSETLYE